MKYPMTEFVITAEVAKRFWDKVKKEEENICWKWLACKDNYGYGRLTINGKLIRTHRISYQLNIGRIPKGLFVCHHCDTPECCNPIHLFLGTSLDNVRDKVAKGRGNTGIRPIGEQHGQAKLSNKQVKEILIKYKSGNYSQEQLGKIYRVSRSNIGYIVNGKSRRNG